MSNAIKVKVTKNGTRRFFTMYYDDPLTGKRCQRSTKCDRRKDAEKAAAKWEAELHEGRYKPASNVLWSDFRERYEKEVLPSLAEKTAAIVATVFNSVEKHLQLVRLRDFTGDRVSSLQAKLREAGLAEASIASYLGHLRAALRWAVGVGLLHVAPTIKMPKRAKASKMMKGRALTGEENERMLAKVPAGLIAVATPKPKPTRKRRFGEEAKAKHLAARQKSAEAIAPSWLHLLRGLWLSGLRLGEALDLWWDDDSKICVDFSGRLPMLRIRAELEKGGEDRMLPITPDFAGFLAETPEARRTGPVFSPLTLRTGARCNDVNWVSKAISAIGEAAKIVVDRDPKTGEIKYASAHDYRRAFGVRWASRVMPAVLKELMRHSDIQTTMRYYVGQNAEATADAVWKAAGIRTFVSGGPESAKKSQAAGAESSLPQET